VINPLHETRIDLQEAIARNETARSIITGFSTALPTLTRFWQQIDTALTDTPTLANELTRLSVDLATIRTDRANLAAAGLATIAAHHDGEPDPFAYMRDELRAQGYVIEWRRA
jgi:hypothetical protein